MLALWQSYTDRHIELLDVRTALAEVEALHSAAAAMKRSDGERTPGPAKLTHSIDVERLRRLTGCSDARKTRRALRRLSDAGVRGDVVVSRSGTPLPNPPRNLLDVADRPVPVPRRWLRELARSGTSSLIAVSLALLLRGSFYKRGTIRLGGTCSAAWIASAFGLDERTAKAARGELGRRGWVSVAESPVWHLQRYGMTFLLQVPHATEDDVSVPSSPPRSGLNVPGLPPPMKNKYLPLRGTGNQNQQTGRFRGSAEDSCTHANANERTERSPTLTDIQPADLERPSRTMALFADAQRRGAIGRAAADRLRFFTTVQHAREAGDRPEALMASLARRGCWHYGTQANEDDARRVLAILDGEPSGPGMQPPAAIASSQICLVSKTTAPTSGTPKARTQDLQPVASVLAAIFPQSSP
ncbi:MAG: hypothetical protein IPM33_02085 [Phycisphaerales bacterium]|nr:hypothetical protein [Phycisphaerales bacterium]